MLLGELLNKKSKQWYLREIILLLITYIKLGTPFHHFLQLLQVVLPFAGVGEGVDFCYILKVVMNF